MRLLSLVCLTATLLGAAALAAPPLEQRYFWTWDHRMEWGTSLGRDVMGGGGKYHKPPEEFLLDYKRAIDYMAKTGFNAVIIWGFIRESHGGEAAARELCAYARDRGVRIIPGVGTSGYEGYVFEGEHEYNVATWLKAHPDHGAIRADGKPRNALCPSHPGNIKWLEDGLRWLLSEFDIGGINFEIGDFLVCHCDRCKQRRAEIPGGGEPDYYQDMALSIAPLIKLARELKPDGWYSYATYTGFDEQIAAQLPEWAKLMPDAALCQWTLTGMLGQWPEGLKPPTPRNIGYLHWGNRSTHSEDHFFIERTRLMCQRASRAGLLGLGVYGELPPDRLNLDIMYRAFRFFMDDPDRSLDDFAQGPLSEMFQGEQLARRMLELMRKLEANPNDRVVVRQAESEVSSELVAGRPVPEALSAFREYLIRRQEAFAQADVIIRGEEALRKLREEGLRVLQGAAATIHLPPEFAQSRKLSFRVRMDYPMENGFVPVMALRLNDGPVLARHAIGRPERVPFPHHGAYENLPSYDPSRNAFHVKTDTDFEINLPQGAKYRTPGYTHEFELDLSDLAREGENVLEIENLERRWFGAERGRLVIDQFAW